MRRTLLLLITGLLPFHTLLAQTTRDIRFRDEPPGQRIQHYYVNSVKDERTDTSSIGVLKAGVFNKKEIAVNLEHGAAAAIGSYIQKNYKQDTASSAADLRITDLQIKQLPGGIRSKTELSLTIAFFINGTKLTEYKGRGEVQTMGDMFKHIEDMVRQSLQNSLQEFDTWWGANKLLYAPDAPVTLHVEIDPAPKDPNQLGYSRSRPLTANDFLGKPDDMSRAAAATAGAIGIKYASTIENGRISVQVVITPFFDKLNSWYLDKHRDNAKVLAHEQRHFDIAAIKACELADTMRSRKLTKSNYFGELELIAAKKQQETNDLQAQYDAETRHGMNSSAQEKWNKLLLDMLAKLTCYK
ncbi:MAG: hypothetical protein J7621_04370 [Niastella sp.]|nr:hypothetical protein [Niastella sp.]